MKSLKLVNGTAVIDEEDYPKVKDYTWEYTDKSVRSENGKLLAKVVTGSKSNNWGYRNGDPKDCRKKNLYHPRKAKVKVQEKKPVPDSLLAVSFDLTTSDVHFDDALAAAVERQEKRDNLTLAHGLVAK